jgi:hypothetical protein
VGATPAEGLRPTAMFIMRSYVASKPLMDLAAGLFLIAHGLVHLGIWLPPTSTDAPFDSHHSWLLGEIGTASRVLAVAAATLLVVAGAMVIGGGGGALAAAGAGLSLVLVLITFHPWFIAAVGIDIAILIVALS